LSGFFAVEIRGPKSVGTVSGLVDGVGYIAAILAGQQFGKLLDRGGYHLGFHVLAGLAFISALLSLGIYWRSNAPRSTSPSGRG
jgi:sugar phosphate permease